MKTFKAEIMDHGFKGFEATVSKEANALLGDALLWRGHTAQQVVEKVQAYFTNHGHEVLIIADDEVSDCSVNAQQAAYTAYKSKGGDMPLSIFLEG